MKDLKQDIKNGTPKSEAFDSFCQRGGEPKKGARYLASIPDKTESEAYERLNYGLAGIYLLLVIPGFIGLLPMLSGQKATIILFAVVAALFIPCIIVWMLLKQRAGAYLVLCFFLFKGMFYLLKNVEHDPIGTYISTGIYLLLISYTIFMKVKLFPFQNFFNTKKDESGLLIYEKKSMVAQA